MWSKFFNDGKLKDNLIVKIAIGLILLVLVVLMYPYGESLEPSSTVGTIWADKDLIAPFAFPIYKDTREYDKEVEEAAHSVYPIFDRNDTVQQSQIESLRVIIGTLRTIADARARWLKFHAASDSILVEKNVLRWHLILSASELNELAHLRDGAKTNIGGVLTQLEKRLPGIMLEVYRSGLVDQAKTHQSTSSFIVRKGTAEEIVQFSKVLDVQEANNFVRSRLSGLFRENDGVVLAEKITGTVLHPNLLFNEHETNRAIQIARENVARSTGFVQQGEHIINSRENITEEVKLKLDSYYKVRAERGADRSVVTQRFGVLLHAALILGLYGTYLFLFRKKIFHNNAMLALIGLLIVMEAWFGYLSVTLDVTQPIQYLIFIPAASMLLAIIFDSRVAFYGTVAMSFLLAGIRGNDYTIALISFVAGTVGAYSVRDIRNRTQIFRSLFFIFWGYALAIVAFALQHFESLNNVLTELTFALVNAAFSTVITYGLLMLFERSFKITTDLTLHELSNFNHPLLRLLSEKAPGTFHHSTTLGSLAEAAAEAIGANPILARVGAYFHDIGKINKPEYFVENQIGTINRHNRLRPRMSALIISAHVKEGVELGRAYGLPEKVLDFIPQHHGTTRMSYFFDKALKQAAARKNPKDVINEEDFRYPGPKPQSKEAGIVMLADSVEASTRSITEMTPQRLEGAIENMIKQRFIEGQLDDCELTLRDLTKIKEAFLHILIGIHHQRIIYPEQQQQAPAVQEQREPEQPVPQQPSVGQISHEELPKSPGQSTAETTALSEPGQQPLPTDQFQ